MRRPALLLCLALAGGCADEPPAPAIDVAAALGGDAAAGYARALEPRRFRFPADHNAHPAFRNEWWYFTGQLTADGGARFGYQVTFFRIAIAPDAPPRDSAWATRQLWMAHAAVTDVAGGEHHHAERLARGALGLAGQTSEPFRVWLEDWTLAGADGGAFPWTLTLASDDFSLALDLEPQRPPLLQGDDGLSQKGDAPGNASYYYSITRLATAGTLSAGGETHAVSGLSWLDREWSTSALDDDLAGWDWFSLQLDSGDDLMLYSLRQKSGGTDPLSAGTLLTAAGERRQLAAGDFALTPERWWRAGDGRRYPVAWRVEVPGSDLDLRVEALLDDQEMATAVRYWEGAVTVRPGGGGPLLGRGYLEMTGYGAGG